MGRNVDHPGEKVDSDEGGAGIWQVMSEIGRMITASPNIDDVYARFAALVEPLIDFDRIDIVSINRESGEICTEFVHGMKLEGPLAQVGGTRPLAGSVSEQILTLRSGILFAPSDDTDVEKDYPRHLATYRLGICSSMMVPLMSSGIVIGSLALMSTRTSAYNEEDLRLAELVGLQISGAVANARLYAERQRVEEGLRESEARYRTLIENMDARVALKDADGRYLIVNKQFAEATGASSEDIIGKTAPEIFQDTARLERITSSNSRVLQSKTAVRYEWTEGEGDASRSFAVWQAPVLDDWSRVSALVSVTTDITAIKVAERVLKESEARQRRLSEENAAIAEIGRVIGSSLDIDEVYESFGEQARRLIPFESIDIVSMDLKRGELRLDYTYGSSEKADISQPGYTRPIAGSLLEAVLRRGAGVLSVPRDRAELVRGFPAAVDSYDLGSLSMLAVPGGVPLRIKRTDVSE